MNALFSFLLVSLFIATPALAREATFTQSCVFVKDGKFFKTDQHFLGNVFYFKDASELHASWSQYGSEESTPSSVDLLSFSDGESTTSEDSCWHTVRHHRQETVVVHTFSPEASRELGVELEIGEELHLDCEVETDEPLENPACG